MLARARSRSLLAAALLGLAALSLGASTHESSDSVEETSLNLQWKPLLRDDLSGSQRAEYVLEGAANWTQGGLRLGANGTARRPIVAGHGARLTLEIEPDPRVDPKEPATTVLGFHHAAGGEGWLRIHIDPAGPSGRLEIVRVLVGEDGGKTEEIVRSFPFAATTSGRWMVVLENGVLEARHDDARVAIGDLGWTEIALDGLVFEQSGGAVFLKDLEVAAIPPPPPRTPAERARIQDLLPQYQSATLAMRETLGRDRIKECLGHAERVLELSRALFGADSNAAATQLGMVGMCRGIVGDTPGAVAAYDEAYRILKRRLGARHPATAHALCELTFARVDVGNDDWPPVALALDLLFDVRGDRDERVAHLAARGARFAESLHRLGDARRWHEVAIASCRRIHEGPSPGELLSLESLASLFESVNGYALAREYLGRASQLCGELGSPDGPEIAAKAARLPMVPMVALPSAPEPPTSLPPDIPLATWIPTPPTRIIIADTANGIGDGRNLITGTARLASGGLELSGDARVVVRGPQFAAGWARVAITEMAEKNGGSLRLGMFHPRQEVGLEVCQSSATTCNARLFERTIEADNRWTERTVRQMESNGRATGNWDLYVHHGTAVIVHDDRRVGAAELAISGARFSGAFIEQSAGQTSLSEWRVTVDPSETPPVPNPNQWAEFDTVAGRSGALFKAADYSMCIEATSRARDLAAKLLGSAHPVCLGFEDRISACYLNLGRIQEATAGREKIVSATASALGEGHPDTARARVRLADGYALRGQARQQWDQLQGALPTLLDVLGPASPEVALAFVSSANALSTLYQPRLAQEYARTGVELTERIHSRQSIPFCRALGLVANIQRQMHEESQAVATLKECVAIRIALQGRTDPETIQTIALLASTQRAICEFKPARELLDETLAEVGKDPALEGSRAAPLRIELAELLAAIGDGEASLGQLQIAAEVLRLHPQGHEMDRVNVWLELADRQEAAGRREESVKSLKQASGRLDDLRKTGRWNNLVETSVPGLAIRFVRLGELETARLMAEQALSSPERDTVAPAATDLMREILAQCETARGNDRRAREVLEQSLLYRQETYGKDSLLAHLSMRLLADVRRRLGDEAAARQLAHDSTEKIARALGEQHPLTAKAFAWEGGFAILDQDWALAADRLTKALALEVRVGADTMRHLPETEALQYVTRIYGSRDQLLQIHRAVRLHGAEVLGEKLRSVPQLSDADVYRAVWTTRSLATRATAPTRSEAEDDPAVAALHRELALVRRQLARLILADTVSSDMVHADRMMNELIEKKERLQRELAARKNGDQRKETGQDARFEELAQALPPGVAVVDFVLSREPDGAFYDAFVLGKSAESPGFWVSWAPLGPAQPIDEAVDALRTVGAGGRGLSLNDGQEEPVWRPAMRRVGELVWDNLSEPLLGCHTVIVIPDGSLPRVPWGALPGRKRESYLIEEYAIATAPHGEFLVSAARGNSASDGTLTLVGGVDYDQRPTREPDQPARSVRPRKTVPLSEQKVRWAELPGTVREAAAIAQLWNSRGKLERLEGRIPTEAELRRALPGSRYIHLATHGFFADEKYTSVLKPPPPPPGESATIERSPLPFLPTMRNPLALSGLVLAGANSPSARDRHGAPTDDDELFTAEEVNELDLSQAELVVLSACETGLGQVANGEGVLGLQRGFHLAGARTVVASLWKVDDDATRQLMVEFYRNLWDRGMGKLEALRAAQLSLLKSGSKYAAPAYWAAFLLSGDWN